MGSTAFARDGAQYSFPFGAQAMPLLQVPPPKSASQSGGRQVPPVEAVLSQMSTSPALPESIS